MAQQIRPLSNNFTFRQFDHIWNMPARSGTPTCSIALLLDQVSLQPLQSLSASKNMELLSIKQTCMSDLSYWTDLPWSSRFNLAWIIQLKQPFCGDHSSLGFFTSKIYGTEICSHRLLSTSSLMATSATLIFLSTSCGPTPLTWSRAGVQKLPADNNNNDIIIIIIVVIIHTTPGAKNK